MRVLVTGSTGFIGSALCHALCDRENTVYAFHRKNSDTRMIDDIPIRHIQGDLCDPDSVSNAVSDRPDVIFHLGAQMIATRSLNRMLEVNVTGTRNVMQAALRYGVKRVVLMSSAGVLGLPEKPIEGNLAPLPINETHCWNMPSKDWPFAWSKYLAEREAQLALSHGLDVVILNPSKVIGAGDVYRKSSSFLVRFAKNPPHFVHHGGINLIPIENAIDGLIKGMRYGKRGERYILGGINLSFKEIIAIASTVCHFPAPDLALPPFISAAAYSIKTRANDISAAANFENDLFRFCGHFLYYDSRKAKAGLRLAPIVDIHQTIQKTWEWFQNNP